MSDPVYYSTIFCFVNSENRDWHLKRLPFFLLLRKLARAAGGRTLGQASFRIPQTIGLAGNAGRKPFSGYRTPPGRQCRAGSDVGVPGEKPPANSTKNRPLPLRGRGSGGWGRRFMPRQGNPERQGASPFPVPHPARQPDAAQAISPCTPDSRHNRRGGLSRYTKHPCLSLRISFFSCLFKSYFLWYNKQSVVNTTRYVYAKSKGNTQDEAVFPKRWECRKQ